MVEKLADQPRDHSEFIFSDEQNQLRAAVRKFCADNYDEQTVRSLMESDPPFDAKVWARLGGELGVLGLSVPEADGGVGGTLVDQAVAVEELGSSLACGPLFGTVFLAIPALVAASAGAARDELLAELVEGRRTAAFAVPDLAGTLGEVTVTADGDALTGTVERVVDAGAADDLLVAARGADGVAFTPSTPRVGCAPQPAGHAGPDQAAGRSRIVRRTGPTRRRCGRGGACHRARSAGRFGAAGGRTDLQSILDDSSTPATVGPAPIPACGLVRSSVASGLRCTLDAEASTAYSATPCAPRAATRRIVRPRPRRPPAVTAVRR